MTRWNNLPNEILAQIIREVGGDDEEPIETKWMMVNKQWHDWYQSTKYKDIEVCLELSDTFVNNIINSKFQPGEWVKCISFEALIPPSDYGSSTASDDGELLRSLMTCGPYVKDVNLRGDIASLDDWVYFGAALKKTNIWNLHTLSAMPLGLPSVPR
jgi:hypothetical protein